MTNLKKLEKQVRELVKSNDVQLHDMFGNIITSGKEFEFQLKGLVNHLVTINK